LKKQSGLPTLKIKNGQWKWKWKRPVKVTRRGNLKDVGTKYNNPIYVDDIALVKTKWKQQDNQGNYGSSVLALLRCSNTSNEHDAFLFINNTVLTVLAEGAIMIDAFISLLPPDAAFLRKRAKRLLHDDATMQRQDRTRMICCHQTVNILITLSISNYKSFQESLRVKASQVWPNLYDKIITFMM